MPNDVVVNFKVAGIADVRKAFESVQAIVDKINKSGGVLGGKRGGRSQADEAARDAARAAKQIEAIRRNSSMMAGKLAAKQANDEIRAAELSARGQAKAAERGARDKVRAMMSADRAIVQAKREAARETERIERDQFSKASAWVRRRESEMRAAAGRRASFGRAVGSHVTTGLMAGGSRVASMAQSTLGLALGGGFGIAEAVQKAQAASGMAADISNSGYNPASGNEANRKRVSASSIVATGQATGTQYGYGQDQTLGALQKFTAITGDLDTGMKTLSQMAELARATGSSLDDVASAAGNVATALPDGADKAEKMMTVMRGIAGQGKMGAVEMRDLASQMAKVVAAAGKFGGDRGENILKMGALAQAARGGGGAWSAASATTAVNSFAGVFGKGARLDAFRSMGIDPFGKDGQLRAVEDIIGDSVQGTEGDGKKKGKRGTSVVTHQQERMQQLFGSVMAQRVTDKFVDVNRTAGGGAAGKAAMKAYFGSLMKDSMMSKDDVKEGAAERMQADDAKLAVAQAEFQRAISTELVPELMKLIPVIKEATPAFVDILKTGVPAFAELIKAVAEFVKTHRGMIQSLASHPIGSLIAFELSKSLVSAGIGESVKAAIVRMMAGGGGGGGGGLGGGAGAAGAMPLIAAGAGVILAANAGVDSILQGQVEGQAAQGGITSAFKNGSQSDVNAANRLIAKSNDATSVGGVAKLIGSAYTYFPDKAMQLKSRDSNDSVYGDGGGDLLDRMKQLASALQIQDEMQAFKSGVGDAANAAATFATAAATLVPTAGQPGGAPTQPQSNRPQ